MLSVPHLFRHDILVLLLPAWRSFSSFLRPLPRNPQALPLSSAPPIGYWHLYQSEQTEGMALQFWGDLISMKMQAATEISKRGDNNGPRPAPFNSLVRCGWWIAIRFITTVTYAINHLCCDEEVSMDICLKIVEKQWEEKNFWSHFSQLVFLGEPVCWWPWIISIMTFMLQVYSS